MGKYRGIIISVVMTVFFVSIIFMYYTMLNSATKENIINTGRLNAIESASRIEKRISTTIDALKLAAYSLDIMIKEQRSDKEILDYLTNETISVHDSLLVATTGIYGYFNGKYMDGSGWVPDADYDPKSRPWYTEAMERKGAIVIVDPYRDLDTGEIMIAISKTLSDGESVVGIDISMVELQDVIEKLDAEDNSYAEFVVNDDDVIVAHSDKDFIGKDLNESEDQLLQELSEEIHTANDYFYMRHNNHSYLAYVVPLEYDWKCISVIDATDDFDMLKIPLIIIVLSSLIIGATINIFAFRSEKKTQEARESELRSERAYASSQAKTSFLSNMSHEIRTPINAILGMNEMILREEENEKIREYSANIKNAGNTLLTLINDILDFSKIEAGKIEIIPVDYDISSVINDLVNMIKTRADNKGLELKLEINKYIPKMLHGDEVRIKQVITNILTNAVKYTEKGHVTLKIDQERIPLKPNHVILKVSVKDTGMGIKAEDMDKLFSKFDRIDEEKNRNIEGTGLGMSITLNLLEMMGSTLEVKSEYGRGSEFFFSLDQEVLNWDELLGDYEKEYRKSLKTKKRYKESFTAPSARVLVVDDNAMNLVVFEGLLKKTLIRIDKAESGDEGIRFSEKTKYDMIFLDHMMPGKDGIDTLKEIVANSANPNCKTPMVCLTANALSGAREQYISEGFNDYLTKPIIADKLEEMLIEYLPDEKIEEASEDTEESVKPKDPSDGKLDALLKEIGEAAENMDCNKLEEAVSGLDSVKTGAVSAELIKDIKDAAYRFDYDGITELLKKR